MGKRKLNSTTFFQCDWTGFPMKSAHCYWPSWSQTGKLLEMIERADTDQDGEISPEEFYAIMTKKTFT